MASEDRATVAGREPNVECPKCGYRMWVGPLKVSGFTNVTMLTFCPVDHYEMVRLDPLGQIEAEHGAGTQTFEDFAAGPNVLNFGTISGCHSGDAVPGVPPTEGMNE